MSGGYSCKCPERSEPISVRRWYVLDRNCNHSAFNGYQRTLSDYSCVQCHLCGSHWRTKADYVSKLRDGKNVYEIPEEQRPKRERGE